MKSITFTCETLTPMFLNGADGATPELRPPAIKAALRFWWRALNAHLPLSVSPEAEKNGVKTLKSLESDIFGGSGDNIQRSNVIVRILSDSPTTLTTHELVPHKPFMKAKAFNPGSTIVIKLSLMPTNYFNIEKLKALFQLACYLGGLGKRVRRGMGSMDIVEIETDGKIDKQPPKIDLSYLHGLIKQFSDHYQLRDDKIILFTYAGNSARYGYITEIQLGKDKDYKEQSSLLSTISKATHNTKEQYGWAYEPSMGYAAKGRYASPVFTSVVRGSVQPIITTLNLAPEKNIDKASYDIQRHFKQQIL